MLPFLGLASLLRPLLLKTKLTTYHKTKEIAMISLEQVEAMIKAGIPDAQVQVQDLTGGGDHLQAVVVSSEFEGKSLIKQHQLVYGALQQAMASEAIHALALKTYTPQDWQATGQAV
jgi:acid stress-induced BolA-like protein IbaG/YrbA